MSSLDYLFDNSTESPGRTESETREPTSRPGENFDETERSYEHHSSGRADSETQRENGQDPSYSAPRQERRQATVLNSSDGVGSGYDPYALEQKYIKTRSKKKYYKETAGHLGELSDFLLQSLAGVNEYHINKQQEIAKAFSNHNSRISRSSQFRKNRRFI